MSRTDLERLTADLQDQAELLEEFTNLEPDPESWVAHAAGKGYQLTSEEAEGLISSYGTLSLEDLEMVAGGWSNGGPGTDP